MSNVYLSPNVYLISDGVGALPFTLSTSPPSGGGGGGGGGGTMVLKPRLGRYQPGGVVIPILGHNMTIAAMGVFILWLGWFGFNPGSTGLINGGSFAIMAWLVWL
jgi:Amt family ammonium transporter